MSHLVPALALAFAASLAPQEADGPAPEWRTLTPAEGPPRPYAVVLPEGFDPAEEHPVLLALPPGGQDEHMVELALQLYFTAEARRRGWVVVSPVAVPGREGAAPSIGAEDVAALLTVIESDFRVAGGRVHLAGISNGGRAAFSVAGRLPGRFASFFVLPGAPSSEEDAARLVDIAALPIRMYVGGEDAGWLEASRQAIARLEELGATDARLTVREGEEHVLDESLAPELFDELDAFQAAAVRRAAACAEAGAVLDELHAAAAAADEERYFRLFAPGGIFVGTDATERWSVAQFRDYAHEPFAAGTGWTYNVLERHVELAGGGDVAWFDERLANAKYGETRGSGVLERRGGRWLVAHYVLSFAVPNEAALAVVHAIETTREDGEAGGAEAR